ncbi:MAG: Fic family protein [Gammaproteobacteria bacterium]|nr:Fic family protein [Gammaproteobacteria bacterium]
MTETIYPNSIEPAFYPNTNTFVNFLGITDRNKLREKEAALTAVRSIELLQQPDLIQQTFDFAHLQAIHAYLFQDLYDWAGMPRSYDMKKGDNIFTPACELAKYENEVFSRSINFSKLEIRPSILEAAESLAACLGIINIFHPFPEGNGRAQRIFISFLAHVFDYNLDWDKTHPWEILETSKAVHAGNYEPLNNLMTRIIKSNIPI